MSYRKFTKGFPFRSHSSLCSLAPFTFPFKRRVKLPIRSSFLSSQPTELHLQVFLEYMNQLVLTILPFDLQERLLSAQSPEEQVKAFSFLHSQLPLVISSHFSSPPSTFCATLLCASDFTQGVGRYFTDTLSRWLIPGKFLTVFSAHSLNFHFELCDKENFFIHQILMPVEDQKELSLINHNFSSLAQELKLNIHAVKNARKILSNKHLLPRQKYALIEESIASLFDRPSKEIDSNIFDQMHHFLLKLSGEEKEAEIKKNFIELMKQKPALFNRDIFTEIRHFVLLFRDKFTALRSHRHIAKTISLLYLFYHSLNQRIKEAPKTRHLFLKLFQTRLFYPEEQKSVLSLLVGINILQGNELFEQRHIFSAIENCLPGIQKVKDSFIVDRRSSDKMRLFYLEIEKKDGLPFLLKERKLLKKRLPRELKGRIENVLHPILLSRNEEEILRHTVLLSRELKYVHDIPQAYISFDAQIGQNLSFTVILLRILHRKSSSLKELLYSVQAALHFHDFETKQAGFVRKKYPKEASVFRVEIDKTPFVRRDFSLDLFKARLVVSEELTRILGEMRDFNGGMLSKQQEALLAFKHSLQVAGKSSDFIVDNFFYSISPPITRSLLPTSSLKQLFLIMLESQEQDFVSDSFWMKSARDKEYSLILIASPYGPFKETALKTLSTFSIEPLDLSVTYVDSNEIAALGIILRCDDPQTVQKIQQALLLALSATFPQIPREAAT
ncbi:MAG TPA: hypothetical protein DCY54_06245 [Parachlamydiales bacterium]|nr:MAG: hypothetical protein A2Z85_01940 [Chlamydiae bacterium GWA2_50_15]OGN54654.1 MAG: hypothetical protein A2098_00935 [Chlamydiae bacterium GWF2_49_8]OGN57620.1 MAG: hypothetical protein A3D18_00885 [Chlamydiae bacterium RIFCSPHIGHO2_02_FULL_49_29]OGN62908.1 MAG: hypothetical protein A3E26_01875 [Chlamydiae bacterium RIFCSPHIGHO2_12_FULL_49_32]OGN68009.1 MAG: hypothetical protein A3I15_04885 [Chlamydiae bacterium RIFCSPLOWO2_02_FULL_49_12]OGN71579.1 MAG: hypothetical protein A3G30_00255 [